MSGWPEIHLASRSSSLKTREMPRTQSGAWMEHASVVTAVWSRCPTERSVAVRAAAAVVCRLAEAHHRRAGRASTPTTSAMSVASAVITPTTVTVAEAAAGPGPARGAARRAAAAAAATAATAGSAPAAGPGLAAATDAHARPLPTAATKARSTRTLTLALCQRPRLKPGSHRRRTTELTGPPRTGSVCSMLSVRDQPARTRSRQEHAAGL